MHRIAIATLFLLGGCAGPRFDAAVMYARMDLDGDVGVQNGSVNASNGFEDLGLDDTEGAPGARVDVKWGAPHLSVAYLATSFSGTGTAEADLSQGGATIPAGATVDSDLDLDSGALLLTFDFLPTDAFELGLGFGVSALDFHGTVEDAATGDRVEGDQAFPFPVLALRGGARFGRLEATALASGSTIEFDGDSADFYDLDFQARWQVFEPAWLELGWRQIGVDADFEEDNANVVLDLVLSGPYLGFVLSF